MQSFSSLQAAIGFINGLNIPESEIDFIQQLPQIFKPYDVRLKHADCDIISVTQTFDEKFNKVFQVQKRYFGGPLSLAECIGMLPKRYQTPDF